MGAVLAAASLAVAAACTPRPAVSIVNPDAVTPIVSGTAGAPPGGLGILTATPAPELATAAAVPTEVIPPPRPLSLAPGFVAGVFAEGLPGVRQMVVAGNGDVVATVPREGRIVVIPDRDRNGVADRVVDFASGEPLFQPFGLIIRGDRLLVGNTDSLLAYPYVPGDMLARATPEVVVGNLPGGGDHWARSLAITPDERVLIGVGSSCNACLEDNPLRAGLLRFTPGGGGGTRIADVLRDPTGLAVQPDTEEMWVTDVGRDGPGPVRAPDEVNRLGAGRDFGWPVCIGDRVPDPTLGSAERCSATAAPAIQFPPYSEPSDLLFYEGGMFPDEYDHDALIALHGTLADRTVQAGYKVVRVPFEAGEPAGPPDDLVSGWLLGNTDRWGRPAGLAIAPDGALLVSDDFGGRIYRIAYAPVEPTPTPWR
jgi:glucose/arabinose dehydrogenase